jgi:O-antigen/teichoic acid export membrane protein
MAITYDTITWLILSLGVNSAIIHFQDRMEERLNAAFWLFIASSLFFVLLQIILAPLIASLYKAPMLEPIIKISAIAILIHSFGGIHKSILVKNIDFKKISIMETTMNVLRNCMYIALAIAGFGVWSFIYPKIVHALISVIWLWKIERWRPKFSPQFHMWGEMLGYGKNVVFSNIIDYLLNNSSYIFIGSMVGSSFLGFYTFGYDKSMMIVNNIAYPAMMISFSSFARLQDHREKLKETFFKTIKLISIISFPYCIAQLILGQEFITAIYGNKWLFSVGIFQIILLFAMVRSITQSGVPVLQAIGKPEIVLKWNILYAPFYLFSIFIGFKINGLYGIAIFTTITGIAGSMLYLKIISGVLGWKYGDTLLNLYPSFVSSLIMGIILLFLKFLLSKAGANDLIILILLSLTGVYMYFLCLKIFFSCTYSLIQENLLKILNRDNIKNEETPEKA